MAVVAAVDEALPVAIVDGAKVRSVVVAGIARLLAELDVFHVRPRRHDAMAVLPCAQQFMQIPGAHLHRILAEHLQLSLGNLEHDGVGLISRRYAGHIFIHQLLQPQLQHFRRDVVGIDVDVGGVILVFQPGSDRAVQLRHDLFHRLVEFGRQIPIVDDVLHHRLGGDTPLGKRARAELVTRSADAIASGKETADGRHPIVAPVIVIRQSGQILRPRDPEPGAARMRPQQIGFGRHQLGHLLVRLDVLSSPDAALRNGHVEKVFPGLRLEMLDLLG